MTVLCFCENLCDAKNEQAKYWRHIRCINAVKSYKTSRSGATVSAFLARLTTVTLAGWCTVFLLVYIPANHAGWGGVGGGWWVGVGGWVWGVGLLTITPNGTQQSVFLLYVVYINNALTHYPVNMCHLVIMTLCMMTSSNGNIFRVTGHLCGEFTGPRWIPHTKASDAVPWCLLWSVTE